MTNLLDRICTVRDILSQKQYNKLKFYKMHMYSLKDELHRHISRKTKDYSYNLDFTSQDLRELAEDIRSVLDDWSEVMNPETNTKELLASVKDCKIDIQSFYEKTIPVMLLRTENIQPLTELLNLVEYHAAFLYILEEASNDKFALTYTERFN